MRTLFIIACCFALLLCAPAASAAGTANAPAISEHDAGSALRQALNDGAAAAVAMLSAENGYFGNPQVRIPLPPALQRIESALRFAGLKRQTDELVLAMNRAAESAIGEAKPLLLDAVRRLSVQDAQQIIAGGDTAATAYFRRTTEAQLTQRLLPIVRKMTARAGLAEQYNNIAKQGVQIGLLKSDQGNIDTYVTAKALDGLYATVAEQEKALRQNPARAASAIVRKVFGTLH